MIQIGKAGMDDLETIVEFQILMAKETEGLALKKPVVTEGVRKVMNDKSIGYYYVAKSGHRTVACLLTLFEWSDWRNAQVVWIHSVFVHPEYRSKGIFRSLYNHVQDEVKGSTHLAGLRLYVDKRNKTAREVYLKMGMNSDHYELFEWLKPKQ